MNFTELLKEWMNRLGTKQADLVKGTGITPAGISRYMSGERKPNQRNVDRILAFFRDKYGIGAEEFWSLADRKEIEYATTVKFNNECMETSIFEDFYETLNNINKLCEEILEKLEKGKEQEQK